MIKENFTFSKNAWHMKLMAWIWGYKPSNFRNMCPYFWFTVFNVVFIVPIVIIKLLVIGFIWAVDRLSDLTSTYQDYCENKQEAWADKVYQQIKQDLKNDTVSEEFKNISLEHTGWGSKIKIYKKFSYWVISKLTPKEREIFNPMAHSIRVEALNEYMEESTPKPPKDNPIKRTTEQIIAKFLPTIKVVLGVVGIGVVLYAAYWIYRLLAYINEHIIWHKFWLVVECIILAVIGIAIIIATVVLLFSGISALWCKYGKFCTPCEKRKAQLVILFRSLAKVFYIFYPIVWLIKGTIFIWEILVALKRDNCPGLIWKEDE